MNVVEVALSSQIKRSFDWNNADEKIEQLVMIGGGSSAIEYYCLDTNTWRTWWDCDIAGTANVTRQFCSVIDNKLYIWDNEKKKVSVTVDCCVFHQHKAICTYALDFLSTDLRCQHCHERSGKCSRFALIEGLSAWHCC